MTIRSLPELQKPEAPNNTTFDIEPRALAAWGPNVAAAAGSDENVISILDYIGENWDGTGITARTVSAALRNIGANPVTVQINSPGGNFFEGLAIYNLLRAHPAAVTVQILGIAASSASIIAMAGDTIQIAKAGLMMIHNTQWVAVGDRHDMLTTHETMTVFDEALNGLYVDRTGAAPDDITAMMDATTFMSGADAIAKGFADTLLPADRVSTATNSATAQQPVAYKVEAVLAKAGVPRAERRKILKELTGGTPGAATEDDATPSAVINAVDDGSTGLSLALARLKLARAG